MLIAASAPTLVVAQDKATPSATADGSIYTDPGDRYTVPIPTNWTVDQSEGFVTLLDPNQDFAVSITVVDGTDADMGIIAGWAMIDPSFRPQQQAGAIEQEVPSGPGIDQTLVITYDLGQVSGQIVQAVGLVSGGQTFVMVYRGSLEAATRRASQIQIITSGFTITAVELVDLSGVEPNAFKGAIVSDFEDYVADVMKRLYIPGVSIAVVQGGKIVYSEGFGVKETGQTDPVTSDTLMMIGSTTKSMTTMMMATEVDDGLLTWDQPVVQILPNFAVDDPDLTQTITVRNLVCACTGVPRRDLELAFNAGELTPEKVIQSLKDFQFFTAFGEAFQYSNQMVAVGGYAAAAAADGSTGDLGQEYADELQARVLDPIGMERTTLSFDDVRADLDYALPHGLQLNYDYVPLPLSAESFVEPIAPAGGVWSSADEMARYVITEINQGVAPDGTRVVSAENLAETWQPQVAVDADTDYGLGWFVGEYKGQKLIYHGGNTYGFSSDLAFLPDADLGIVILTNAQGATLFTDVVRAHLLEMLFDQPEESSQGLAYAEDQIKQAKTSVSAQIATKADPDSAEPFLGRYSSPTLGEITLSLDGDQLILDAGEFQTELVPLKRPVAGAPNYYMFDPPLSGLPVELRQDDGGDPEVVIHVGTEQYVFAFTDKWPIDASPVADGSPEAEPEN